MSEPASQQSFFQDLWDRRFFQFFATYLGICWGLIQFMEWLVNRYELSSIYVDKLVVFLLLILPFVISFIYIHGRKGDDEWHKFEKVFYPINIVAALGCSLFLINSNATTETVKIETLEGDTISREIPKAQFTKRIILFPFESNLGQADDWKELGINLLLEKDLEQDMRMVAIGPVSLNDEFEDYGAEPLSVVPFGTAIKIAKDKYCDAFLTGKIEKQNNLFTLTAKLFETKKGKLVSEVSLSSENIYGLTDQLSSHIQKELSGYKLESENKIIDLPSQDLITDDPVALSYYVKGNQALAKSINDVPTMLNLFGQAVKKDAQCAECHASLAQIQSLGGQSALESMKTAMEHIESLPERQQLRIKYYNYFTQNEPDKAIKLLEIWRKLYPQDTSPYEHLVGYYKITRQFDKAKEVALEALDNGHKAGMYLTLADLFLQTNDFEQAEKYVSFYEKEYPERAKKKPVIGKVYTSKGDFDKAMEFYEKQNVLDPNDQSSYKNISDIHVKRNEFEAAKNTLREARERAKSYNDSLGIITAEMKIFNRTGEVKKYYEKEAELKTTYNRHLPPAVYIQTFYSHIQNYGLINDTLTLRKRLDEVISIIPQQKSLLNALNDYLYYMTAENLDSMSVAYERAKEILVRTNGEQVKPLSEGMMAYYRKDYKQAITYFNEYVEQTGTADYLLDYYKSVSYRKLEQFEQAHEMMDKLMISDPLNPLFNLEKAQIFNAEGKQEKAKQHLQVALEVWENADPEYVFAIEAKELSRELSK